MRARAPASTHSVRKRRRQRCTCRALGLSAACCIAVSLCNASAPILLTLPGCAQGRRWCHCHLGHWLRETYMRHPECVHTQVTCCCRECHTPENAHPVFNIVVYAVRATGTIRTSPSLHVRSCILSPGDVTRQSPGERRRCRTQVY
jgi:hypothetical protein